MMALGVWHGGGEVHLDDASLVVRNFAVRVPEQGGVLEPDGGDATHDGVRDHVRRIKPAPDAHL